MLEELSWAWVEFDDGRGAIHPADLVPLLFALSHPLGFANAPGGEPDDGDVLHQVRRACRPLMAYLCPAPCLCGVCSILAVKRTALHNSPQQQRRLRGVLCVLRAARQPGIIILGLAPIAICMHGIAYVMHSCTHAMHTWSCTLRFVGRCPCPRVRGALDVNLSLRAFKWYTRRAWRCTGRRSRSSSPTPPRRPSRSWPGASCRTSSGCKRVYHSFYVGLWVGRGAAWGFLPYIKWVEETCVCLRRPHRVVERDPSVQGTHATCLLTAPLPCRHAVVTRQELDQRHRLCRGRGGPGRPRGGAQRKVRARPAPALPCLWVRAIVSCKLQHMGSCMFRHHRPPLRPLLSSAPRALALRCHPLLWLGAPQSMGNGLCRSCEACGSPCLGLEMQPPPPMPCNARCAQVRAGAARPARAQAAAPLPWHAPGAAELSPHLLGVPCSSRSACMGRLHAGLVM
jgi:hypothetical protein